MGFSLFRRWTSLDRRQLAIGFPADRTDLLLRVRVKSLGCVALGWASDDRIIEEIIPTPLGEVVLHCKSLPSMTLELRACSRFPAWGKIRDIRIEEEVSPSVLFPRKQGWQLMFGESNLLIPSKEFFEYFLYGLSSLFRLPFPFRIGRKLAKAWVRASRLPGYKHLRRESRFGLFKAIRPRDLASYPTVSKEVFRVSPADFTTPFYTWESATSGSTGEPFRFFHGDSHQRIMSISNIAAAQYGLNFLGGYRMSRFSAPQRAEKLRTLHLTNTPGDLNWQTLKNGDLLIRQELLERSSAKELVSAFQPSIVNGLPSLLLRFSGAFSGLGRVPVAVARSEHLLDADLPELENTFDVVVGLYGQSEGLGFALRCPECKCYSQVPLWGFMGLTRSSCGELARVVGCSFRREGTQFFNYEVSDLVEPVDSNECKGCPYPSFPFGFIAGRSREQIETRDGRLLSIKSLINVGIPVTALKGISRWAVRQDEPGHATFVYSRPLDPAASLENELLSGLNELDSGLGWDIERNDSLFLSQRGKRSLIVE